MSGKQLISSILLVTDLLENAGHSFSLAAGLADACGAGVTVLHIIEKLPGNSELFIVAALSLHNRDELEKKTETRIQQEILRRIDRLDAEADDPTRRVAHLFKDIRVVKGEPGKQIRIHLQSGRYDAIIVEKPAGQMQGRTISWRTIRRILRAIRVPVFIVSPPGPVKF